ncbi:MAG: GNAT family N-acetyltransferase [Betaproteobacteria bacterium]|nr:GNAT family N-acetyltransferase [Betaproteobacteria bacterium]
MFEVVEADLSQSEHAEAVLNLLNAYALDAMGGGEDLSEFARANLIAELRRRPSARVILAYADGIPAGLAICFEGFSTFACKPLLNIHDLAVAPQFRGQGISKLLLRKAEEIARQSGCCKLTLEVLEGNVIAQAAYRACGYAGYALDPKFGKAMSWQRKLE